jgi:hypothetical protein
MDIEHAMRAAEAMKLDQGLRTIVRAIPPLTVVRSMNFGRCATGATVHRFAAIQANAITRTANKNTIFA